MSTSALFKAFNTENGVTENGCKTQTTSFNACVDLFFVIGASRGKDVSSQFSAAFAEDKELATRILLWARDIREGAGERQTFRSLVKQLISYDKEIAEKVLNKTPEFGRWDDVLSFLDTELEDKAILLIKKSLMNCDGLCAKWMPRKGNVAYKLRKAFGVSPKAYRKMLVSLTDVVESKMCNKEWTTIEFGKVPSLASARYQQAFGRNAQEQYSAYIEALQKGDAKINAGAIYPYDVVKSIRYGNEKVANEQWKALPNYLEGSKENILPLVDVSGSMGSPVGGNNNVSCMDVAVSLGIYLSERTEGVFKDVFVTFSEDPEFIKTQGTLKQRMEQMVSSKWGMSTNIARVFEKLLSVAVEHKFPENEMPTKLLIVSDMEFNRCINDGTNVSMFNKAKALYEEHGYKLPTIIFWRVNVKVDKNIPVSYDQNGTALVSGFSPSIMKNLLGDKDMSPLSAMLETVMKERYNLS